MSRWLVLVGCLALSACTALPVEEPPTVPLTSQQPAAAQQSPAPDRIWTVADLLPASAPLECVQMVELPAEMIHRLGKPTPLYSRKQAPLRPEKTVALATRAVQPVSLPALVTKAQQEAVVQPTAQTYFGRTADARYPWQPGRIYTVLVAPGQQTLITLPPKEVLLIGLTLRDEEFLVINKKVGKEDGARYVISITPQAEAKGEYQVALLTDSGHQYNLQLVVGTVSMRSVTFEVPPIHEEDVR